ncbi:MAG: TIR domain-containing protein [Anaerolineae bacterium]|nr:TIR domain-containing protein [Anaerolineae bacterium]
MQKQAAAFLKNIFSNIDEKAVADMLKTLGELLSAVDVRKYPENTTICHEGQLEDVFYVIISGQVGVYKELKPGTGQTQLATKGPGEFFGEMALILDEPRSADVRTIGESIFIELNRETFENATRHNPAIAQAMRQVTVNQLDENKRKSDAMRGTRPLSVTVFTSYSRRDEAFVAKLVDDLRQDLTQSNVTIWLDKEIPPGSKWDREVQDALERSTAMLLILSPHAIESDNVSDEWNYYLEKRKTIIPIVRHDCEIPFRLRRLQYIDLTTTEYETALARIHNALAKIQ